MSNFRRFIHSGTKNLYQKNNENTFLEVRSKHLHIFGSHESQIIELYTCTCFSTFSKKKLIQSLAVLYSTSVQRQHQQGS